MSYGTVGQYSASYLSSDEQWRSIVEYEHSLEKTYSLVSIVVCSGKLMCGSRAAF